MGASRAQHLHVKIAPAPVPNSLHRGTGVHSLQNRPGVQHLPDQLPPPLRCPLPQIRPLLVARCWHRVRGGSGCCEGSPEPPRPQWLLRPGLSLPSFVPENLSCGITVASPIQNAFPFSTCGENIFLPFNVAVAFLIVLCTPQRLGRQDVDGKKGQLVLGTTVAGIAAALVIQRVDMEWWPSRSTYSRSHPKRRRTTRRKAPGSVARSRGRTHFCPAYRLPTSRFASVLAFDLPCSS